MVALSVTFGDTSPIGRGFGIPQGPRLSLWESWREAPERARTLTENHKRSDSIALTEGLLIAAQRLSGDGLALSVTFGDTSPKGRGFRHPRATQVIWPSGIFQSLLCRNIHLAKVAK